MVSFAVNSILPILAQGWLAASGGSSMNPLSSLAKSTLISVPRIIPLFICRGMRMRHGNESWNEVQWERHTHAHQ